MNVIIAPAGISRNVYEEAFIQENQCENVVS